MRAERGGFRSQLGREFGLIHIDADAGDGFAIDQLNQDAGAFLPVEHEIVGPAEIAENPRGFGDRFDCGEIGARVVILLPAGDGVHVVAGAREMKGEIADELAGGGFCYTAFVTDVFARAIVGWQVLDTLKTELALDALEMALWARQGKLSAALIHHGDRGMQYTSIRYGKRLTDAGIERSVGSTGDSYDNALAESVNALYKKELIDEKGPWNDVSEVTLATAEWVYWYNHERLHSWCGHVPPVEFEEAFWQGRLQGQPAVEDR